MNGFYSEEASVDRNVIIIGAGGHGKVLAYTIKSMGKEPLGFLADGDFPEGYEVNGYPILGGISDIEKWRNRASFIVAIGNAEMRKHIMENHCVEWITVVHPTAVIGDEVVLGQGTCVLANANISCNVVIGCGCIINTGSIVEHDCVIGNHAHISAGTTVAGASQIGEMTWVGVGATVSDHIHICNNCMIGAGAVVVKDITVSGTYVGVPAKRIVK